LSTTPTCSTGPRHRCWRSLPGARKAHHSRCSSRSATLRPRVSSTDCRNSSSVDCPSRTHDACSARSW
jgi:hypothetical protein